MLGTLITAFFSGEAGLLIQRTKAALTAYVIAAFLALVAFVFLLLACYVYVARWLGPVWGAVAIAGVFLVLAILVIAIHAARASAQQRRIERKRQMDMVTMGSTAAVAVLPTLLRKKQSLAFLAAPVAAAATYWIYKRRRDADEPD